MRLVAGLEAFALENGIRRRSLYTRICSKAGWSETGQFTQHGVMLTIVQKHLA